MASATRSAPTRPMSSASSTMTMRGPVTRLAPTLEHCPEAVPVTPVDHVAQLDLPAGLVLRLLSAQEQRPAGLQAEEAGVPFVSLNRLDRQACTCRSQPEILFHRLLHPSAI